MAKLTKVHAARQLGISRTTLYKLIDQGKISATADGCIDETERVRAAPYVDTVDSAAMDTYPGNDRHEDRVHEHVHEHVRTRGHEQPWTGVDTLVDILREQLQRAQERERAYEERERVMQDHIAQLTAMLHESQQQNQRLLDIPRPAPQDARGATQARIRPASPPPAQRSPQGRPETQGGDPRGTMRRRIVALLQEHPEGLTPAEMRTQLGVDKSLADTCLGMLRYGLLRRVERGRYVATAPSRTDHT